jgi:HAD superfamily hydrolase (TIGR01662 family)
VGRPSLATLLRSLAAQDGPLPEEVVVVDDRPLPPYGHPQPALDAAVGGSLTVRVVRSYGRGPAAARNLGWQQCRAPWVAFLDDDVVLPEGWAAGLARDLAQAGPRVAGSQGTIRVPLPTGRRATDWERSTAGLESARWATADMAYRREALQSVSGFDERFPRAYREDADLALRVRGAGWSLVRGCRIVEHPVRPASAGVSVRVQRGNTDDALFRRLHGSDWRAAAQTGRGRLAWHVATTAAAALALIAAPGAGRSRALRDTGLAAAAAWAALSADFARRRIAPGPREPREVLTMVWTSVAIPPAAVWHRASGWWRHRHATAWPPPARVVLFDRDGTLVEDVPYNGDPSRVAPVPGAREAVDRLRRRGVRVGVVSNQSGVGRGLLTSHQVASVNAEVERRLGPFDTWQVCPHGPDEACACRKPRPGMVLAAARALGVRPQECVVIGDIGADTAAARAAGARAILVPTAATRSEEVDEAPVVATDLAAAVDLALGWCDA